MPFCSLQQTVNSKWEFPDIQEGSREWVFSRRRGLCLRNNFKIQLADLQILRKDDVFHSCQAFVKFGGWKGARRKMFHSEIDKV